MSKKNAGGLICLVVALVMVITGICFVTQFFGTEFLFDNAFISDNYHYVALVFVILSVVFTAVGWCLSINTFKNKEETAPEAPEMPAAQPNEIIRPERGTKPANLVTVSYSFCGNCGKRNKAGGNFCAGCGERI